MGRYHETLIMGAIARIYEDGLIEIVSEPKVCYCSYMHRVYGVEKAHVEALARVIRLKIATAFLHRGEDFLQNLFYPLEPRRSFHGDYPEGSLIALLLYVMVLEQLLLQIHSLFRV